MRWSGIQNCLSTILNTAVTISFLLGLFIGGQNMHVNAQTSNAKLNLKPGQSAIFKVMYENQGDIENISEAILEIYVGSKLIVDPEHLLDNFGNTQTYCVSSNTVTTDPSQTAGWGTKISYRPKSATTTSTPCNGQNTPGPTTIPASFGFPSSSKQGLFTFKATLSNEITDSPDTLLNSNSNQGVFAKLSINSTSKNSFFEIRVMPRDIINPTCPTGQELFNQQCTNQCPSGQSRDTSGQCQPVTNSNVSGNSSSSSNNPNTPTSQNSSVQVLAPTQCPSGTLSDGTKCVTACFFNTLPDSKGECNFFGSLLVRTGGSGTWLLLIFLALTPFFIAIWFLLPRKKKKRN